MTYNKKIIKRQSLTNGLTVHATKKNQFINKLFFFKELSILESSFTSNVTSLIVKQMLVNRALKKESLNFESRQCKLLQIVIKYSFLPLISK